MTHKPLFFLLTSLFACRAPFERISPTDLAQTLEQDPQRVVLIDVRSAAEFQGSWGHLPGAINLPYPTTLAEQIGNVTVQPDQIVVLICLSGHRSKWALPDIHNQLSVPVLDLEGGMLAWWQNDLPTTIAR